MKKLFILAFFCFFSLNSFASPNQPANKKPEPSEEAKYQALLEEYKGYLATVPKEVVGEIENYKKEIGALNKKKQEIYKKLSQEAQKFLSTERSYKKKISGRKKDRAKTYKSAETGGKSE